ncbi:MAG: hypothetical protein KDE32_15345 [Novosphingobium sp.]|nr:hypothetical protein [Novosphingobium sp.]
MRRIAPVIAATALVAAITPLQAAAKDEPAKRGGAAEVAEKLNDPMTQYAVAGMISAMSKALLEMPVAPMIEAVEQASGRRVGNLPRDARVADLAGTSQDEAREKIVEHVPRAMAALGAMAGAAETMMPELERMARSWRESLPKR